MLASALLLCSTLLADPTWVEGPALVPGAPPARNPALAVGGGRVHAVFRQRMGGLGAMVAGSGEPFSAVVAVPGGEAAATGGNKNYPALAVDAAGVAHVAWAPGSAPGNGAHYGRIAADGAPLGGPTKISARWVESLAVAVAADEVHVLLTAIKQDGEPDGADGVFDLHGPVDGGPPLDEVEAWPFPNFAELAAAPSPPGGLALVARWDVIKRLDLAQGQWGSFKNVEVPPGSTSVGRPQLAFDGTQMLWAAVGWVDATPTSVEVRAGGPKQPWTALAAGGLFDPQAADGEPAVALAVGPDGERAVAWLAAGAPRLRVAIGTGDWGQPVALPGTDDATSFALAREAGGWRVVFAREDGALVAGRVDLPEETETTTTGETGPASTGEPSGTTTTETTGEPPVTTGATSSGPTTTGPATTGPATSDTPPVDPPDPATTGAAMTDPGACGCRHAEAPLVGWLLLALRRRRAPARPRRSA